MYKKSQPTSGIGSQECLLVCQAMKRGNADIAMAFMTSQILMTEEGFPKADLSIVRSSERLQRGNKNNSSI